MGIGFLPDPEDRFVSKVLRDETGTGLTQTRKCIADLIKSVTSSMAV